MYPRLLEKRIKNHLFKGKAVVIYGARRVGKTTLVRKIQTEYRRSLYLNCDEPDVRLALTDKTSTELIDYIGEKDLVIIDEAQRVRNIGLTLKLLVDNAPRLQVIATGSSSFDLSNKTREPLTGRAFEFHLAPFLLRETSRNPLVLRRLLEARLVFGLYPEVIVSEEDSQEMLKTIYKSYLYKDALEYQGLKNPELIEKLLVALSLQVGSEVSYTELASLLGVDQKTVASYIRLLEQAFIIFRLPPLSRNLRKEISKSRKIYFFDTGVRNAIINNFNPLSLRNDAGQLWENFVIAERFKKNEVLGRSVNCYFWRTWSQQEIDYVEEEGGILAGWEIKWESKGKKPPKAWAETYKNSSYQVINKNNFLEFV
ncbi:ATP-binding protein [Candidatus Shapirobacteria bacterium]|nr:ATP-binding protein [Candidatus Shapirobacteria bacterium]